MQFNSVKDLLSQKAHRLKTGALDLPHLGVYVGECTSCSMTSFGPTDIDATRYDSVHFLFDDASPVKVQALRLPSNVHLKVLSAGLMRDLASEFTPRAYLFTQSGNLLGYQASMPTLPSFVHFRRNP